jgi:hypothetical protein
MRLLSIPSGNSRYLLPEARLALLVSLIVGSVCVYNLGDPLVHDDDGTDLYENWRLGGRGVPRVDLVKEQVLVLLLGDICLGRISRSELVMLRGVSAVLILERPVSCFYPGKRYGTCRPAS